jgi:hypothetical protein
MGGAGLKSVATGVLSATSLVKTVEARGITDVNNFLLRAAAGGGEKGGGRGGGVICRLYPPAARNEPVASWVCALSCHSGNLAYLFI